MNVTLVMTIIGPDRPGLVDLLSSLVAGHGGNWLESRMALMAGQFAGILRIHVPAERQGDLVHALGQLENRGLSIAIHSGEPDPQARMPLATLDIVGLDQPGIVYEISHILALHGVNVEELSTECGSAPMSGETLFQAKAHLRVPELCDVDALRAELEKIAADLMVDISFVDPELECSLPKVAAA